MCDNSDSRQYIMQVVNNLKSDGTFDQLRRECLTDVDTKPSYRNLLQRVEGYVSQFLSRQQWSSSLNKNQLRNRLRIEIDKSEMLKNGIYHLVDQIVNEKIKNQFSDKIEIVLKEYLGIKDKEPELDNLQEDTNANEEIKSDTIDKDVTKNKDEDNIKIEDEIPSTKEPLNDIKIEENVDDEYDNISNENYWPTPPKPEMCTPEHTSDHSIPDVEMIITDDTDEVKNSHEQIKMEISDTPELDEPTLEKAVDELINITKDLTAYSQECVKVEDLTLNDEDKELIIKDHKPEEEIKDEDKSGLIQEVIDACPENTQQITQADPSEIKEEQDDSDISEISSVHTSDLSSFDDEISFDDTDEETNVTKKKVSLKVAKKLAASISEEKVKEDVPKVDEIIKQEESKGEESKGEESKGEESKGEESKDDESHNEKKKINKRKRKLNPKFASTEFSYNLKSKKAKIHKQNDDTNQPETTRVLKPKKSTEPSDKTTKLMKQSKFSENSTKKSQAVVPSVRPKRTPKTTRNDQSNKRYDSSDLYKPRHSLSSRRTRSGLDLLTTDSNSNSTNDDMDK